MGPVVPASGSRSRSVMTAVVLAAALTAGGDSADAATPPTRAIDDISRYCLACWRNARLPADRWGDCTQQVFTRLLERVSPTKWWSVLSTEGDERREFIRAIDAVKKRTQRDRKAAPLTPDVPDRKPDAATFDDADRQAVVAAMNEVLSDRQRRIVELTAAGWAVNDIAAELAAPPERISDEKYKAIRKLRAHFGVA